MKYRWRQGPSKGRWNSTPKRAREAAARADKGSHDAERDVVFLDALTWIEDEDGRKVG